MTPSSFQALFVALAFAIVASSWVVGRYLIASRQARAALTADKQYRSLTDEYRRLSDLAVTAQEHTDLRLTQISVRLDALAGQVDQLQHILKEVE
jgi:TolA-binding protein